MNKLLWCGMAAVGVAVAPVWAGDAAAPADGKALFESKCGVCHGKDGKAEGPMGKKMGIKDLTDAKYQATLTDDALAKATKEGVTKDGKVLMKAFDQLSADEVKALVAHMRSLVKKEDAAAAAPAEAKPAEAKEAKPATP